MTLAGLREDLHVALAREHDVGGLEVAVHDSPLVGGFEAAGHLACDPQDLVVGERAFVHSVLEGLALHQLHGQELDSLFVFEAVDRCDVRVLQAGQQSRLALEARDAFRVARHLSGQDLDRDLATELGVARAIDLAHAALAESADDFVAAEGLADQV
jgi:hypothetical protein